MTNYIGIQKFELLIDKKDLRKALRKVGNQVKHTAKGLILEAGTGKKYGKHTASLPGMAPASLTGTLANSMKVSVRKETVRISDVAYYALFLEAGTKKAKGSIAPRPFLSQAFEKTDVQGILDKSLENIIDSR